MDKKDSRILELEFIIKGLREMINEMLDDDQAVEKYRRIRDNIKNNA